MSTLRSRSWSVSICYALLAVLYVGILGLLANGFWAGSLRQLRIDTRQMPQLSGLVGVFLVLIVIHALMSVLTFRYYNRPRGWRLVILGVATLLFAVACYRAYSTLVEHLDAHIVPPLFIPADVALAFSYGFCAWILWRIHVNINNQLEQRSE